MHKNTFVFSEKSEYCKSDKCNEDRKTAIRGVSAFF